jgi:UDP-N-acetylglucosamine/UDP-N-acetylgalactosamine diphosphorylase
MPEIFALNDKVLALTAKGVKIPCPHSVEIGDDVTVERISGKGVVFHSGTKVFGGKTVIGSGVVLGHEAPLTAVDCVIGPGVELKGGYCRGSLFLDGAAVGSGAQVREGCILEEGARGGHCVGLKQTILFPFVTLGSLVNFCDCLMAGGTSKKDHSEVGSSYIHFNYTPEQDKATPSLIGDVPQGVMVNRPPIFLGGQGGAVGPVRIGYGTVVKAGTILRKDVAGGKLVGGGTPATERVRRAHPGDRRRKIRNNILYLANLVALREWYERIRGLFFERSELGAEMKQGALVILEGALDERLRRLREFIDITKERDTSFREPRWDEVAAVFAPRQEVAVGRRERDVFVRVVEKRVQRDGADYIRMIKGLGPEEASLGTAWLQAVVDESARQLSAALLPGDGKEGS